VIGIQWDGSFSRCRLMQGGTSPKSTNELSSVFDKEASDQALNQTGKTFSDRRLGSLPPARPTTQIHDYFLSSANHALKLSILLLLGPDPAIVSSRLAISHAFTRDQQPRFPLFVHTMNIFMYETRPADDNLVSSISFVSTGPMVAASIRMIYLCGRHVVARPKDRSGVWTW
jgi:hypothetical protein